MVRRESTGVVSGPGRSLFASSTGGAHLSPNLLHRFVPLLLPYYALVADIATIYWRNAVRDTQYESIHGFTLLSRILEEWSILKAIDLADEGDYRLRMRKIAILIVAATIFVVTPTLFAHPHLWIDYSFNPAVENGMLTAVHAVWAFDEYFSDTLIKKFKKVRRS